MAKLGKIATKRRGRGYKTEAVDELEKLFGSGDGIVLMNNKGLTVAEISELRKRMRESKVAVKVAKNTLIKLALKNTGYELDGLQDKLVGPTLIAVGLEDPVTPAKLAVGFLKDHEERLEIKGGILEKKVLDARRVVELSKLPGREELIARMLGSLQAPVQNMAYALNAAVSQFAWALNAHQKKLEEGGSPA